MGKTPTLDKCPEYDIKQLLYNIWHGFSVHSWWPHVLWQTVTLWLVNRVMAVVGVGRSNRCVTRRRPHDNHALRFRQRKRIWSRARDTQPIRGLGRLKQYSLQVGASITSLAPWRRFGTRSPLSEYMSLHLSLKLRTNCGPLSRIKWERYIFIKKCFSHSLNCVNHVWLLCNTIWWWGSSNAGALGNVEYPFIGIAPRSTLTQSGSTW